MENPVKSIKYTWDIVKKVNMHVVGIPGAKKKKIV